MNRNANDRWLGGGDLWYKPWRCNLDLFNFLDDSIQAVDN